MKKMYETAKRIGRKVLVGSLIAGAGFGLGKLHSRVDRVTFDQIEGLSGFKVITLHKPFAENEVFSKRNYNFHWLAEDANGEYFPVRENVENSYGKGTEFGEETIGRLEKLNQAH